MEDSAGGPDVTVGILPKLDKVTLLQVLPNTFKFILAVSCWTLFCPYYSLVLPISDLKMIVSSRQMDAKLQLDTFENVMQLAIEGCKAVAAYIREVRAVDISSDQVTVFIFS